MLSVSTPLQWDGSMFSQLDDAPMQDSRCLQQDGYKPVMEGQYEPLVYRTSSDNAFMMQQFGEY